MVDQNNNRLIIPKLMVQDKDNLEHIIPITHHII